VFNNLKFTAINSKASISQDSLGRAMFLTLKLESGQKLPEKVLEYAENQYYHN
jgi:hypothetical protein